MGLFVNPDNSAFQVALNSEIYIDKTGLLKYTNKVMDTRQALICNSRPRRFGKTTTADMLTAYYSRGCHSETMFDGKEISKWDSFKTHLNRYDLIRLDVQWFLSPSRSADTVVSHMEQCVLKELLILRILKLGILPEITPLWAFGNDFSSFQAVC